MLTQKALPSLLADIVEESQLLKFPLNLPVVLLLRRPLVVVVALPVPLLLLKQPQLDVEGDGQGLGLGKLP
jgi:hypothetical protein